MVVRIKKKRRRGERSYHGSHKKWRGGGSRGGRGKAGYHKHKWSYAVKYEPEHFGKRGFIRPQKTLKKEKVINVEEIDKFAEKWLGEKIAEKENDKIKINLQKIGYEKVLGSGKISRALVIEAKSFSKEAKEKIEKSGGKAVII